MKKVILIVNILLTFYLLQGCNMSNSGLDEKKNEIYVSNYTYESYESEVVVLDEELNFIKRLTPKGGIYITSIPELDEVFAYGSAGDIGKISVKDKKVSNIEVIKSEGIGVVSSNNSIFAIDSGYFREGNLYKSDITNLDTKEAYTFIGFPMSYAQNGNDVYIVSENMEDGNVSLIKFNTVDKSFESHTIRERKNDKEKMYYKVIPLEDSLLLMDGVTFNISKIQYDNLDKVVEVRNILDYGIDFTPKQGKFSPIFEFISDLDENNLLIGINDGEEIKLIKVNKETGDFEQILKGQGKGYQYLPSPVVSGDYIYISFVKRGDYDNIKKYNWKTNELIKEVSLNKYFENGKQIGNLTLHKWD